MRAREAVADPDDRTPRTERLTPPLARRELHGAGAHRLLEAAAQLLRETPDRRRTRSPRARSSRLNGSMFDEPTRRDARSNTATLACSTLAWYSWISTPAVEQRAVQRARGVVQQRVFDLALQQQRARARRARRLDQRVPKAPAGKEIGVGDDHFARAARRSREIGVLDVAPVAQAVAHDECARSRRVAACRRGGGAGGSGSRSRPRAGRSSPTRRCVQRRAAAARIVGGERPFDPHRVVVARRRCSAGRVDSRR